MRTLRSYSSVHNGLRVFLSSALSEVELAQSFAHYVSVKRGKACVGTTRCRGPEEKRFGSEGNTAYYPSGTNEGPAAVSSGQMAHPASLWTSLGWLNFCLPVYEPLRISELFIKINGLVKNHNENVTSDLFPLFFPVFGF